ncbi:DUF4390 domain-containing protein [Paucibacter sp. B2R-40]|uniref:DUF4390 domain-containing protein n=1 Tax=Paucibacter sp. B2R-40 TaxID=2893554 RepID=UPI0021E3AD36|nr:DUF4390 domain-containing protein [Paucibacter sp. B2R-40]MCV2352645.1 DUF4390 domain-containing protein [Paucibacter sp. B2R-40]
MTSPAVTAATPAFSKHASRAASPLLRRIWCLLATALLLLGLGFGPEAAQAEGVELAQLSTQRTEEGLELSFSTRFELTRAAEDALMKGVPIYFVAEADVWRNRWYWRDARIARASRTWRLAWQPLTRQFKVSTGGLNQSYASLPEALASLRGAAGWRIAENRDLEDGGRFYLEFSYRLDTSQLPKPMQIGLGSPQGWGLNIERTLNLAADFSSSIAAP